MKEKKTRRWLINLCLAMVGFIFTGPAAFGAEILGYTKDPANTPLWYLNLCDRISVGKPNMPLLENGTLVTARSEMGINVLASRGIPRSKIFALVTGPGFSRMSASPGGRQRFANQVRDLFNRTGISGVALNWEHPRTPAEVQNYTRVFQTLRQTLGPDKWIGAAVEATRQVIASWGFQYLNSIQPMGYGWNGRRHTLAFMADFMRNWHGYGCPKNKLHAGIGFFGGKGRGIEVYNRIIDLYNPPPHVDTVAGITFTGQVTARKKMEWIKRNGYGGAMVWMLEDDKINHPRSLLAVMAKAKGGGGGKFTPARPNEVCFFDGANWQGFRECAGVSQGTFGRNHNDKVSAVSVGARVHVIVYKHGQFKGPSMCIPGGTNRNNLGRLNDQISSFRVIAGRQCRQAPLVGEEGPATPGEAGPAKPGEAPFSGPTAVDDEGGCQNVGGQTLTWLLWAVGLAAWASRRRLRSA